jgi:hypothetical protein
MSAARVGLLASLFVGALLAGCDRGPLRTGDADEAGVRRCPLPSNVHAAAFPVRFDVGRAATPAKSRRGTSTSHPDGHWFAGGIGTPRRRRGVCRESARRVTGRREGQVGAPRSWAYLRRRNSSGANHANGFPFGQDPKLVKTWATTAVRDDRLRLCARTMPLTAPDR